MATGLNVRPDSLISPMDRPLRPTPGPSSAASLNSILSTHADDDPEFWAFKANSDRRGSHGIFQYPAMMVPQLQGTLLDDLLQIDPGARLIYDPFVGSGTVVIEAMQRGFDIVAADISPFALLLCAVKSRPLGPRTTLPAITRVIASARSSRTPCALSFKGIDKWFTAQARTELFRLHEAITREPGVATRRFLWTCLAETVRLTSNSRTSTFKLHVYAPETMATWRPEPVNVFERIARHHARLLEEQAEVLTLSKMLRRRQYVHSLTFVRSDVKKDSIETNSLHADVLMTSPPYGDNQTTVPYGQHSFLPLRWIDLSDLPVVVNADEVEIVETPSALDRLSLGGSRVGADKIEADVLGRSDSLSEMVKLLRGHDPALRRKLVAYAHDLDASLDAIIRRLRPGAFMFWTLGERRIGGLPVPLTEIVGEMLERHDARYVSILHRRIPGNAKRMALRNDRGATMRSEAILVMQKGLARRMSTDFASTREASAEG